MEAHEKSIAFGRVALIAGIILVALRGIDLFTRMPGLPAFWYTNQSMWIAAGLISAGFGWYQLWGRPTAEVSRWQPDVPGCRFRSAILYVRQECHLCDEAMEVLRPYLDWIPLPTQIDIDDDPSLVQKFGTCVPVLVLDGKVRFRGRIHELLLRRLIQGTPPISGP